MAAKRTSAPAAAVTRDAGPRPTARTPSRLQYVSGLLIDYAQLLCMGAAILVVQLAVLLPPLRRLLSQLYERAASDSERVEEQAARGLISAEARGRHYVFKSIDFDDFLRSVGTAAYLRTRLRWWRQQRQWEAEAPLAGVAAGCPMRDGPLLRLSDGCPMRLSDLVRPGRLLLLNFGSCT